MKASGALTVRLLSGNTVRWCGDVEVVCPRHVSTSYLKDREPVKETGTNHDTRAIHTLYESWFCAMESGDVAAILSLVTPDVIVKTPGSPPMVGRNALEQTLRARSA